MHRDAKNVTGFYCTTWKCHNWHDKYRMDSNQLLLLLRNASNQRVKLVDPTNWSGIYNIEGLFFTFFGLGGKISVQSHQNVNCGRIPSSLHIGLCGRIRSFHIAVTVKCHASLWKTWLCWDQPTQPLSFLSNDSATLPGALLTIYDIQKFLTWTQPLLCLYC